MDRRIEDSMNVPVLPEHEAFIQQRVQSGQNDDAPDVVGEALDLLAQTEHDRDALRAALAAGEEDIRHGRVTLWTPDLLPRLLTQAIDEAASGSRPHTHGDR